MNRIIIVTAIIAVSIVVLYGYYSGFSEINFREGIAGGERYIFESTMGDYNETDKAAYKINRFFNNKFSIIPSREVSFYEINPHVIDKKNLKSEGGCILPGKDTNCLSELRKIFKVRNLPRDKYIISEIPYKGKISVYISHIRLYPRLYRYCVAKNYDCMQPVTEIYDLGNRKIIFRMKQAASKERKSEKMEK